MITKENEFKISDIGEFGLEPNTSIEGQGVILGMAFDYYGIIKTWIILITRRDTEFLKNKPEKALILFETQMRLSK